MGVTWYMIMYATKVATWMLATCDVKGLKNCVTTARHTPGLQLMFSYATATINNQHHQSSGPQITAFTPQARFAHSARLFAIQLTIVRFVADLRFLAVDTTKGRGTPVSLSSMDHKCLLTSLSNVACSNPAHRIIPGSSAGGFRRVEGPLPQPSQPVAVTWEPVGSAFARSPITQTLGITGKESTVPGSKKSPVKQCPVHPQAPPIPELTPL